MFDKRTLRRTFGPKRDEIIGDSRKLHDEELHRLYSPPNITRIKKSNNKIGRVCSKYVIKVY
jgi:hypothetical protein